MTAPLAIPDSPARTRRGRRWGVIAAAGGAAVLGCAWTAAALINVPDPVTLTALAVIEPSSVGTWFPSRIVQPPRGRAICRPGRARSSTASPGRGRPSR